MTAMNVPTSPRFSPNSKNCLRARGIVATFGLLCLTGFLTGIALPLAAAHAQTAPTDDGSKVPVPAVVFHLRAENAAPTRAVLQERRLTGLSIHGPILASKAGEPHIIRLSASASDPAATTRALEELGKKHAAAHPPLRVPNQHDAAIKQNADERKAGDDEVLSNIAKKSQSNRGFMDFTALAKNFHGAPPLSVTLTPQQPTDPTGKAHLVFIGPKTYLPDANMVMFQNTKPSAHKEVSFFTSKEVYTPDSFLAVDVKVQAGKTYIFVAKAYWGTFPFNEKTDAVDDYHAIHVTSSNDVGIADGKEVMIPGGTPKTSFVVQCDKDGWYTLTFAGLANPWTFTGITIKEIAM